MFESLWDFCIFSLPWNVCCPHPPLNIPCYGDTFASICEVVSVYCCFGLTCYVMLCFLTQYVKKNWSQPDMIPTFAMLRWRGLISQCPGMLITYLIQYYCLTSQPISLKQLTLISTIATTCISSLVLTEKLILDILPWSSKGIQE